MWVTPEQLAIKHTLKVVFRLLVNALQLSLLNEIELNSECTEKVLSYLETLLGDTENYEIAAEISTTMQSLCYVISCINQASESIGKDGRFQLFVCIGVR